MDEILIHLLLFGIDWEYKFWCEIFESLVKYNCRASFDTFRKWHGDEILILCCWRHEKCTCKICALGCEIKFSHYITCLNHTSATNEWDGHLRSEETHKMIPRTCWMCPAVSEISSWKVLELVPSFSRPSLLLVWRTCTFINIQYAVALLTKMGYRLAQESSEYHLQFRTYAGWIKSLLIFFFLWWQVLVKKFSE